MDHLPYHPPPSCSAIFVTLNSLHITRLHHSYLLEQVESIRKIITIIMSEEVILAVEIK